jgi:hypothetical protein
MDTAAPLKHRLRTAGSSRKRGFLALALVVLATLATLTVSTLGPSSHASAQTVDACGKSDWTAIVPDEPGGFDFVGPCQRHDECRAAGDNQSRAEARACHDAFQRDLIAVCNAQPELKQANNCAGYANGYYNAVLWANMPPFKNADVAGQYAYGTSDGTGFDLLLYADGKCQAGVVSLCTWKVVEYQKVLISWQFSDPRCDNGVKAIDTVSYADVAANGDVHANRLRDGTEFRRSLDGKCPVGGSVNMNARLS